MYGETVPYQDLRMNVVRCAILAGMKVSPSSLRLFGNCAMAYKYEKIDKLGYSQTGSLTVLGNVWHYAVDVYETYDYNLELGIKTFKKYWSKPSELGLYIDFWHRGSTYASLQKRGVDMLEKYHELAPWKMGQRIGSEIHFVVPIGDHELSGIIDKLHIRPGQKIVEVTDFKTGNAVEKALKWNIQFTAYCYATTTEEFWKNIPGYEDGHERFKDWKRQGWWYHARNNKPFNAGYREEADYKRLLWAITQMEAAISANAFPLSISGETCNFCAFTEVCGSEVSL